ncbi:hypothetical protein B0H17DRAFT_1149857 [Mycena rosella]|uniref:Uncharacterized protein n=1 Tax=Mycena rosella TaxID=1033263 RepID=A0AAD7BY31_MYCRO|nr:hypothetical protein B0H17DRAFT_1149857 [Mycena rosella]
MSSQKADAAVEIEGKGEMSVTNVRLVLTGDGGKGERKGGSWSGRKEGQKGTSEKDARDRVAADGKEGSARSERLKDKGEGGEGKRGREGGARMGERGEGMEEKERGRREGGRRKGAARG